MRTLDAAKLIPVFNKVMGAYVAPEGTVAVTLIAEAAVTLARVAPKNTMLLLAVGLKLVPVKVTTSPGLALNGVNEIMTGGGITLSNTEMVLEV